MSLDSVTHHPTCLGGSLQLPFAIRAAVLVHPLRRVLGVPNHRGVVLSAKASTGHYGDLPPPRTPVHACGVDLLGGLEALKERADHPGFTFSNGGRVARRTHSPRGLECVVEVVRERGVVNHPVKVVVGVADRGGFCGRVVHRLTLVLKWSRAELHGLEPEQCSGPTPCIYANSFSSSIAST